MTSKELNDFRKQNIQKIRKENREEIFSKSRSMESQPPVVAIIPSIVQEKNYEFFEEVLDSIQPEDLTLVNDKYKDFIMEKMNKQADPIIKFQLFRLINRLKIPYQAWFEQYIDKLQHWKQFYEEIGPVFDLTIFLKQLAFYLEDDANRKQVKQKEKLLSQILRPDIEYSVDALVYLTDILIKLDYAQIVQNQAIFKIIEQSLKQAQNQFLLIRILELVSKIDLTKDFGYKLIKLQHFSKLCQIAQNNKSSIDIIILILQILSTLVSGQQSNIYELLQKHPQILPIFQKFQKHILDLIRVKIFWAYSNIAASQKNYHYIKTAKIIEMCQVANKQTKIKVKIEIIFTILNWTCNANSQQLQEICEKFKQFYHFLSGFIKQPESSFFSRALYAIYNVISRVQIARIQFQKEGLVGELESSYQRKQSQEQISAIQYLLQTLKNEDHHKQSQSIH